MDGWVGWVGIEGVVGLLCLDTLVITALIVPGRPGRWVGRASLEWWQAPVSLGVLD